jgi:hypothetical protein
VVAPKLAKKGKVRTNPFVETDQPITIAAK